MAKQKALDRVMARQKPRYTGVLRRRMPNPTVPPVEWLEAYIERIIALTDHYGVDRRAPDSWEHLALALAGDHVEGFQIHLGKGGRPPDPRQTAMDIALFVEVWKAREENRTDASAYRIVANRRRARGIKMTEVTLRKRFNDLIKPGRASERMRRVIATWNEPAAKKSDKSDKSS